MARAEAPERLLAKSPRRGQTAAEAAASGLSLPDHLADTGRVAQAIVDAAGSTALTALGLEASFTPDELRSAVVRGAWLHDLGKANSHFQRMMLGRDRLAGTRLAQAFRHEYVSAWLGAEVAPIHEWLFDGVVGPRREAVMWAALLAALNHHVKLPDLDRLAPQTGTGDSQVVVFANHADFRGGLAAACKLLTLPEPPSVSEFRLDLTDDPLAGLAATLIDRAAWLEQQESSTNRFVALAKALVIAADVAASAVLRTDHTVSRRSLAGWARQCLERTCTGADLDSEVIAPQIEHLGGLDELRDFQRELANTGARVSFVRAGCGSGKTLGAYLWARRHAEGRRLFLCYPTTGTATQGFREYVLGTGIAVDSALLHSRAEADIEGLQATPEQPREELAARLDAIRSWDVKVAVCTVDRVLGILANARASLFTSPAILQGAFVFDEIHLYDETLFAALLRFLATFTGCPILLMTASLPEARRDAIATCLRDAAGEALHVIDGPAKLEEVERYRVRGPVPELPWEIIERVIREGGRVLWVSNRVSWCMDRAREAEMRLANAARAIGVPAEEVVLPYHSRYRYCDRLKRHNDVIKAFDLSDRSVLAVTTQVCEVSLDISAQLLVTDLASVPALIQRLGRLNRRVSERNPGSPRDAIVCDVSEGDAKPYTPAMLTTARQWLDRLATTPGDALSQRHLTERFAELDEGGYAQAGPSPWLDGGVTSSQAPLRDASGTVAIVREEDVSTCTDRDRRGHPSRKWLTRHTIPMLLDEVRDEIWGPNPWPQHQYVFEAPAGRVVYDERWGAKWALPS